MNEELQYGYPADMDDLDLDVIQYHYNNNQRFIKRIILLTAIVMILILVYCITLSSIAGAALIICVVCDIILFSLFKKIKSHALVIEAYESYIDLQFYTSEHSYSTRAHLLYSDIMALNLSDKYDNVTISYVNRSGKSYKVNIESLNVSASSIKDIHKYTITAWSDEEQIVKIVKQIDKKIDVVKVNYYTDDQLFIHEVALYKISTPVLLENPEVSRTIRRHDARMMEVNPTYSTVLLAGLTEDIASLFQKLNEFGCLLQYTRSGRIAVTRSMEEPVSELIKNYE